MNYMSPKDHRVIVNKDLIALIMNKFNKVKEFYEKSALSEYVNPKYPRHVINFSFIIEKPRNELYVFLPMIYDTGYYYKCPLKFVQTLTLKKEYDTIEKVIELMESQERITEDDVLLGSFILVKFTDPSQEYFASEIHVLSRQCNFQLTPSDEVHYETYENQYNATYAVVIVDREKEIEFRVMMDKETKDKLDKEKEKKNSSTTFSQKIFNFLSYLWYGNQPDYEKKKESK